MEKEHFVTLFDQAYLPQGLCLYESLSKQCDDFCLWVICLDSEVAESLKVLNLPQIKCIPLAEAETEELLSVKAGRNIAEYCWTLTPFSCQFVMDREPSAKRVTYLDADLYFFKNPQILLSELEMSKKDVLITEHAYDPEFDQTEQSGKYCVQFMTFTRNEGGLKVMKWWQDRCIEWCFAKLEDGKFGDQKYLEQWPTLFNKEVHVLTRKELAMGPWNIRKLFDESNMPVFFHFHGTKLVAEKTVLMYSWYKIGNGWPIYSLYKANLKKQTQMLKQHKLRIKSLPLNFKQKLKLNFYKMTGRAQLSSI